MHNWSKNILQISMNLYSIDRHKNILSFPQLTGKSFRSSKHIKAIGSPGWPTSTASRRESNFIQLKYKNIKTQFQFIFFSRSWLKRVREHKDEKLPVLKSLAYKNETVLDLLYRMVDFSKKDERNRDPKYINNAAARAYAGKEFTPEKYVQDLRKD